MHLLLTTGTMPRSKKTICHSQSRHSRSQVLVHQTLWSWQSLLAVCFHCLAFNQTSPALILCEIVHIKRAMFHVTLILMSIPRRDLIWLLSEDSFGALENHFSLTISGILGKYSQMWSYYWEWFQNLKIGSLRGLSMWMDTINRVPIEAIKLSCCFFCLSYS